MQPNLELLDISDSSTLSVQTVSNFNREDSTFNWCLSLAGSPREREAGVHCARHRRAGSVVPATSGAMWECRTGHRDERSGVQSGTSEGAARECGMVRRVWVVRVRVVPGAVVVMAVVAGRSGTGYSRACCMAAGYGGAEYSCSGRIVAGHGGAHRRDVGLVDALSLDGAREGAKNGRDGEGLHLDDINSVGVASGCEIRYLSRTDCREVQWVGYPAGQRSH
ncbi:hypothetical protein GQ53DRAFT_420101 [Thozetella sp. PMI_491]|nr:hypothetical protein GQ53DRAFT_420101 [Thozetella sp. PMI_491]